MSVSCFDSAVYAPLYSDREITAQVDDVAEVRSLARVEAAAARAIANLSLSDARASMRLADVADAYARGDLTPDPDAMARGTARYGEASAAFAVILAADAGLDEPPRRDVGVTDGDVADAARAVRVRAALDLCAARLSAAARRLEKMAQRHGRDPTPARRRGDIRGATSFGMTAASWRAPLRVALARVFDLESSSFVVVFETNRRPAAAAALAEYIAESLDAALNPAPRRSGYGRMAPVGAWLADATVAIGAVATEMLALARPEAGELRFETPRIGDPPTEPRRALGAARALAQMAIATHATLQQAALSGEDPSGPPSAPEGATLSPLLVGMGAAATRLCEALDLARFDADRARQLMREAGLSDAAIEEGAAHAAERLDRALADPRPLSRW